MKFVHVGTVPFLKEKDFRKGTLKKFKNNL